MRDPPAGAVSGSAAEAEATRAPRHSSMTAAAAYLRDMVCMDLHRQREEEKEGEGRGWCRSDSAGGGCGQERRAGTVRAGRCGWLLHGACIYAECAMKQCATARGPGWGAQQQQMLGRSRSVWRAGRLQAHSNRAIVDAVSFSDSAHLVESRQRRKEAQQTPSQARGEIQTLQVLWMSSRSEMLCTDETSAVRGKV